MQGIYIITGGAGFIGSNLVKELNSLGIEKIIIVDSLRKEKKWENLKDLIFYDFINYEIGIEKILKIVSKEKIDGIYHLGANSDVLDANSNKMVELNFEHSKHWLSLAIERKIPFIFASSSAVYGNSLLKEQGDKKEEPHNIYALSKAMFEQHLSILLSKNKVSNKIIGFRFFNTYGIGEFHKGKNASLVYRFYEFLKNEGRIKLFENGEKIRRDYVWVRDSVRVLAETLQLEVENGVYDLGTGVTTSHKELALLIINIFKKEGKISGDKEDEFYIEKIPFPENLKGRFQFFTKANNPEWMKPFSFTKLEEGAEKYLKELFKREEESVPYE